MWIDFLGFLKVRAGADIKRLEDIPIYITEFCASKKAKMIAAKTEKKV